jgi:hypothetical protein
MNWIEPVLRVMGVIVKAILMRSKYITNSHLVLMKSPLFEDTFEPIFIGREKRKLCKAKMANKSVGKTYKRTKNTGDTKSPVYV